MSEKYTAVKNRANVLDKDVKAMGMLLDNYKNRYKQLLMDIIKDYGTNGKVKFDAKAVYGESSVNCGDVYIGRLTLNPTVDWQRPYSIAFVSEKKDGIGSVYAYNFEKMLSHDSDLLNLFEEYVLPFVQKAE